jgi:type IV pilus assembly protein PilV
MIRKQRGISMVESLVALVVISVGMLGIAGLYLSSLQASRSAKLRSYAVELAGSISDKIRANRDAGAAYDTSKYGGKPKVMSCDTKQCSAADIAQDDLANWIQDVKDQLPGAAKVTATLTVVDRGPPDLDSYLITITWREANSDIDYSYVLPLNLVN